jgi:excisionase family DNA binding protein
MGKQSANNHDNGTLMTVREVAAYLRISEATVYKWAKGKKIPAIRLGRNWRFQKLVVEEWMKGKDELPLPAS